MAALAVFALVLGSQPAARAASAPAPAGPTEGIKVHGHWTIDILHPDGSLVSHHEFENDLANHLGASTFLNGVLSRTKRVGKWQVALSDTNGQPLLWIVEPGSGGFGSDAPVLSVTAPTSGPNAGKLVLSGSGAAPRAAQISTVQTETDDCPPSESASCVSSAFAFTQRVGVESQVPPVQAGQIVQLTVVISFS